LPVPEIYYMFVLMGIYVSYMGQGRSMNTTMQALILGLLMFAGIVTGMPCRAQYNSYESQAGPAVLSPPRHQKPVQGNPVKEEDYTLKKIDRQPEFPGGNPAIFQFIHRNLKYPPKALKLKLQGKVYVGFTVKEDGSVDNVSAMRGIGAGCDEEAVRVIKLMPKWKPAETDGKPIESSLVVPVKFAIDTLDVKH
jgi:TonB family protein